MRAAATERVQIVVVHHLAYTREQVGCCCPSGMQRSRIVVTAMAGHASPLERQQLPLQYADVLTVA